MKTYRVAIVGLTAMGAAPAEGEGRGNYTVPAGASHAASFAALPNTEVVAACDLDPQRLDDFRRNWGNRFPHARTFTDYREMLTEGGIDVLTVATSDHRHADIVVEGCERGARGIFCEKPIATTLEDADRMIAAAECNHVVLSVNHTRRWYPLYQLARAELRAGALGRVTRVIGYLGGPRAMLFRNASHLIDTLLMLAESRPEWVIADLDPGFEDYFAYRGDGGRDPSGDPGGSFYIRFEDDTRAMVSASKSTPPGFYLEFYGERGRMRLHDQEGMTLTLDGETRTVPPPQPEAPIGTPAAIAELIRCLDGELPTVSCGAAEARLTLQTLLAFLDSQRTGHCPAPLPTT